MHPGTFDFGGGVQQVRQGQQKMTRFGTVALVTLALAVPGMLTTTALLAGGPDTPETRVELTGFITDMWCGKSNANAEGVACIKSCAEKGSDVAIYADGKLYKLDKKELALEHVGYEVVVTGKLATDGSVEVAGIKRAQKPTG